MRSIIKFIIVFMLSSCCSKEKSVITIFDDFSFEPDKNFKGVIYYKKKHNNQIKFERSVYDGQRNGVSKDYYENGKVKVVANYLNNTLNGRTIRFDSATNKVSSIEFYLNGLNVSDSYKFENSKLLEYEFYSLEGLLLYRINYNEIGKESLFNHNKDLFFINKSIFEDNSINFFIYKLSPLRFRLDYSIVKCQNVGIISDTVEKINTSNFYFKYNCSKNDLKDLNLAIKVTDSLTGDNFLALKELK